MKIAAVYSLTIGIALILVMASHIIRPLRKITDATKKVATGNLNAKVNVDRDDEIGELAHNFNIMVDELNSIEYLRKDFVSNISHELKTPIASIQGFTKLLADDNLSKEEKNEYINIILEETERLSNLSSNMLKLSKLEKQGKIFEKFYQVEKSRSSEGSGLGLAIVKRIVDLIKGEIEVESKENKGTKIIITIPKETQVLVV